MNGFGGIFLGFLCFEFFYLPRSPIWAKEWGGGDTDTVSFGFDSGFGFLLFVYDITRRIRTFPSTVIFP